MNLDMVYAEYVEDYSQKDSVSGCLVQSPRIYSQHRVGER